MVKGGLAGKSRAMLLEAIGQRKDNRAANVRKKSNIAEEGLKGLYHALWKREDVDEALLSEELAYLDKRRDERDKAIILFRQAQVHHEEKREWYRFVYNHTKTEEEFNEIVQTESLASYKRLMLGLDDEMEDDIHERVTREIVVASNQMSGSDQDDDFANPVISNFCRGLSMSVPSFDRNLLQNLQVFADEEAPAPKKKKKAAQKSADAEDPTAAPPKKEKKKKKKKAAEDEDGNKSLVSNARTGARSDLCCTVQAGSGRKMSPRRRRRTRRRRSPSPSQRRKRKPSPSQRRARSQEKESRAASIRRPSFRRTLTTPRIRRRWMWRSRRRRRRARRARRASRVTDRQTPGETPGVTCMPVPVACILYNHINILETKNFFVC